MPRTESCQSITVTGDPSGWSKKKLSRRKSVWAIVFGRVSTTQSNIAAIRGWKASATASAAGRHHRREALHEPGPHGRVLLLRGLVGVIVDRPEPGEVVQLRVLPPERVQRGGSIHHVARLDRRAADDLVAHPGAREVLEQQHERGTGLVDVRVVRRGHAEARSRRALPVELDLVHIEAVVNGDADGLGVRRRDLADHRRGKRDVSVRVGHSEPGQQPEDPDPDPDRFDLDGRDRLAERLTEPFGREVVECGGDRERHAWHRTGGFVPRWGGV